MIETCVFADEVAKDFEEEIDLTTRAGATCIELRGGIWGRAVQNCTDEDVARMKDILAKYASRVAVIGSPVGKCDMANEEEVQTHVRWFDRMCELAHTFGTNIIRGFAFWTPSRKDLPRPNLDEMLPQIAAKLTPIARRAKEEGVYFCFEPEASTCSGTCAEITRIIDAISPNDNLMVAWDCNNSTRLGEHPLNDAYPLIRGRVKHLHVKPNRFKNIETVWDSDVSYRELFQRLMGDGYEGVASVEHWGSRWLMLEGVRQTSELLRQLQP